MSLVLTGGLLGVRPNLAARTATLTDTPFVGAYLALAAVALLAMALMAFVRFPPLPPVIREAEGRALGRIITPAGGGRRRRYGVMNLLVAATPMTYVDVKLSFDGAGAGMARHRHVCAGLRHRASDSPLRHLPIVGVGVLLNAACIAIALSGVDLRFLVALFLLGVGWNFLFTGSTTLSLRAYRPEGKDRAEPSSFCMFSTMAVTSFASGALVTTQGWALLNLGSLLPVALLGTRHWPESAWRQRAAHNAGS